MGLFDQSQGLMGLGQQPQQGQPQYDSPMNQSSPTDALDRGYMNLIHQRSQAGLSYPSAE